MWIWMAAGIYEICTASGAVIIHTLGTQGDQKDNMKADQTIHYCLTPDLV